LLRGQEHWVIEAGLARNCWLGLKYANFPVTFCRDFPIAQTTGLSIDEVMKCSGYDLLGAFTAHDEATVCKFVEALGFDNGVAQFPGALGGLGGGLDGVGGIGGEGGVIGAVGDAACACDMEGAFGLVLADEAGLGEEFVGVDLVVWELVEAVLDEAGVGTGDNARGEGAAGVDVYPIVPI
jgi:hypothetical protein